MLDWKHKYARLKANYFLLLFKLVSYLNEKKVISDYMNFIKQIICMKTIGFTYKFKVVK